MKKVRAPTRGMCAMGIDPKDTDPDKDSNRSQNTVPRENPMSIHKMGLLSIILTAAPMVLEASA